MSKLFIVDAVEKSRVPFLRGILTRSLLDAGLEFEDAYLVSTRVRDALLEPGGAPTEVTAERLAASVIKHLRPFGDEVLQRYEHGPVSGPLMVRSSSSSSGQAEPFSRGRHRLSLQASGIGAEESMAIAEDIYERMLARGVRQVTSDDVERLTRERIAAELGDDAGARYDTWTRFVDSDQRVILLLGGAPGCGKSTIATRIAHILDIERTQSTDMLREVMRAMIPERLVPALHASTFTAWKTLPDDHAGSDHAARVVAGYLSQMELLALACEAVIQRASKERLSIILEGVHVHPALLARLPLAENFIVVPIMLAVLKKSALRERLQGRGRRITERRSQRYLKNFDSIWRMQDFLLSEADAAQIPIISNEDRDRTVQQVMLTVNRELSRRMSSEPHEAPA